MYIGYFSYRGLLNSPYFSVSLYLNVEILCDMEEHFSDDDGSMLSRQFDEPFVFDMLDAELRNRWLMSQTKALVADIQEMSIEDAIINVSVCCVNHCTCGTFTDTLKTGLFLYSINWISSSYISSFVDVMSKIYRLMKSGLDLLDHKPWMFTTWTLFVVCISPKF